MFDLPELFYFSPDANGEYRVREGRVVQARVIAVADKSIRVIKIIDLNSEWVLKAVIFYATDWLY